MHLTEDQVWKYNELVEEGYNVGFKIKRGASRVPKDPSQHPTRITITSDGQ
jgi:hypothetical protein